MANPPSDTLAPGAQLQLQYPDLLELFVGHPFPIFVFDAESLGVVSVNEAAIRNYGYSQKEFLSLTADDLRPAEDAAAFRDPLRNNEQNEVRLAAFTRAGSLRHVKRNGDVMLVDLYTHKTVLAGSKVIVAIVVDVTDKAETENELKKQVAFSDQLFENSPEAIVQLDGEDRIVRCNPAFAELFGWQTSEARGQNINALIAPADRRREAEKISSDVLSRRVIQEEAIRQKKNGERVTVAIVGYPVYFRGEVVGIYGVYRDITETKRISERLAFHASHDDLTGLINRREIARVCNHALEETGDATLLYLDLDQFKLINDTSGHLAGDRLLCEVATRLRELMRESDSVARLGGDEFAILLRGCNSLEAEKIAQKIIDELRQVHFSWEGHTYQVSASIGICEASPGIGSFQELLGHADEACYVAKEGGRNRYHLYAPDDDEVRKRHGHMSWAVLIPEALKNDQFELFVQKIVPLHDLHEDEPQHFEVLLRYRTPAGELMPPADFLAAAERYDLIDGIDRWVVRATLARMQQHSTACEISVNLSGLSIGDRAFPDFINQEILRTDIDPGRLCFEITETAAIQNIDAAIEFIKAMHVIGAKVALDDFGSGMSSFAYMKRLPVNRLKIDGQFIRDISHSRMDRGITRSMVDVSKLFGIETVAEFVESANALDVLKEIGVDYAQGFHLHKPEPWA